MTDKQQRTWQFIKTLVAYPQRPFYEQTKWGMLGWAITIMLPTAVIISFALAGIIMLVAKNAWIVPLASGIIGVLWITHEWRNFNDDKSR